MAEGTEGLQTVLARIKDSDGLEAHLTDASEHDLLTNRDWTKEIGLALAQANQGRGGQGRGPGQGNNNPFFLFTHVDPPRPQFSVTQSKAVPKYYLIVRFPNNANAQAAGHVELLPQTWWMLGIFAVLCYALARHVTSPLRKMQKAVERFGQGDFTARVNSRRGDELG